MATTTPSTLRQKTIAVIGLGQIGGSILKRLAETGPKLTLLAHDRDRRLALKVARYAEWVTSLRALVSRSDIVILAVPVPSIVALVDEIAHAMADNKRLLVLDTGTVAQASHKAAAKYHRRITHLGFHPLAGAEGEGWESSRSDLFAGKRIAVTTTGKSRPAFINDLAKVLGATVMQMTPRAHDRAVAEAIGLPHLLAFAAQGITDDNPLRAGSWSSLTRVAASNPDMVAGFLSVNAAEQKRAISEFEKELKRFKRALSDKSGKALLKLLADRQRTV